MQESNTIEEEAFSQTHFENLIFPNPYAPTKAIIVTKYQLMGSFMQLLLNLATRRRMQLHHMKHQRVHPTILLHKPPPQRAIKMQFSRH